MILKASQAFFERFGAPPTAGAVAPGRVEVLGNHTDYNGGYVLSAAIDRVTALAGSPEGGDVIALYAADIGEAAIASASSPKPDRKNPWAGYVLGVVDQLRKAGVRVGGFQAAIVSEVPLGSGLSSSAALEVATALLLAQLYPFEMEKMEVARLCQRAENQFVGVSSGLMDQFSSVFGQADSLLFLDCLTQEHETIPLHRSDVELVICNSIARHALTGGDYNTRRAECMAAGADFGKTLLRDVTLAEFEARRDELPENQRRRAEHVLRENERVLVGRVPAARSDLAELGALMVASHRSSRTLFENSTPDLYFLVEAAVSFPGCYGARLTGGGWGGATINLVEATEAEAFRRELARRYHDHTGIEPQIFATRIASGARAMPVA